MICVIAEKPSVGNEIAKVLGAREKRNGYFEGNGYCVTWGYGHLLELTCPEATPKWSLDNLPIIPEKGFTLKPTDDEGARKQLGIIEDLLSKCDKAVIATDAGREGEVIGRDLLTYCHFRKPFDRLWISSLTEKAIREGFSPTKLKNGHSPEYENLWHAGKARAEADWLVGINATRVFTLSADIAHTVLSLGRVQTVVLCMICDRYLKFKNFKKEPFWFLQGTSVKDGIEFKWRGVDWYSTEEDAVKAKTRVEAARALTVDKVKIERKTEDPPLLFNLGSLQKQANSRFGFTLDYTLELAQSLYEKKLISYPRSESRYIPEDVFECVPALLEAIKSHPEFGSAARELAKQKLHTRSVDDTKLTDHHGIIITENSIDDIERNGKTLTEDELLVYGLIVARFLEAFSPVCIADVTKVELSADDVHFIARGRKEISLGWRAISKGGDYEDISLDQVEEVELNMRPLPKLKEGERILMSTFELIEDETKPTPLYTDATLATAMENAGNANENHLISKALKGIGIGTVATRANIVETIVKRRYVERVGKGKVKKIIPTNSGLMVYHVVKDMQIANVELTALWELELKAIANGEKNVKDFRTRVERFAKDIVNEFKRPETIENVKKVVAEITVPCPNCKKPISFMKQSAWCKECGFRIYRTVAGKTLNDALLTKLIKNGETGLLSGFKSKDGTSFDAALALEATTGRVSFMYPNKNNKKQKK